MLQKQVRRPGMGRLTLVDHLPGRLLGRLPKKQAPGMR